MKTLLTTLIALVLLISSSALADSTYKEIEFKTPVPLLKKESKKIIKYIQRSIKEKAEGTLLGINSAKGGPRMFLIAKWKGEMLHYGAYADVLVLGIDGQTLKVTCEVTMEVISGTTEPTYTACYGDDMSWEYPRPADPF